MSRATDDLSDGPEGRLSRREVVRLVSGAIAMSAVPGVPASLRAEAYQGGKRRPQVQIKYYWTDERSEATLMHREALPPVYTRLLSVLSDHPAESLLDDPSSSAHPSADSARWVTDVDAAVSEDCRHRGLAVPEDLEERVELHLETIRNTIRSVLIR